MPAIAPQLRARTDVDRLLDAACVEFAEQGYHRATMASIARRAQSTKPTLYAHLGSKDTLHRVVLEREAAHCRQWLFTRYESAIELPLDEQVTANVQALFDYVAGHPEGFQLLFGSDNTGATLKVRQALLETIGARIVELLRTFQVRHQGRARGANQQLAETLVGIAVTGAQFATKTNTSLERAGQIASRICVGALTSL
jgi:AcrR family transcriptional regulator